jgi:uncharacterized protein (UPF0276 family)
MQEIFHASLPRRAGIGLKPEHVRDILQTQPDIGFFEIHAENYMMAGGPMHHFLSLIRAEYPLSLHGVGLSIGGEDELDRIHLTRLKTLIDRYQPESFSEHLAWSSHDGTYYNDLLPLPYTQETLDRVCAHIDQVQDVLKRSILLENPATYLEFSASEMDEAQFITHIIQRTGCGLLLDINNLYVSGVNHGRNPSMILEAMPLDHVGEMHLAGHTVDSDSKGFPLLIDSHDGAVTHAVWLLYEQALSLTGRQATLIERDHAIPALEVLLAEAERAENYLAISQKRDCLKSKETA